MSVHGWRITLWVALLLVIFDAAWFAVVGLDEAGVRSAVRVTARIASVLFCLVFAASSLRRLWRTPATKWLLANRRYLGVSFAVAHALHLGTIALFAALYPDTFWARTESFVLIVGGFVTGLVALMALTSSDRAQAALGRNWRRLHLTGGYLAWGIYMFDYVPGLTGLSIHTPFALLVLGSVGLRVAAWRRARGGSRVAAAGATAG